MIDDLRQRLEEMPQKLYDARLTEWKMSCAFEEAKHDLEVAEAAFLALHPPAGSNADTRKRNALLGLNENNHVMRLRDLLADRGEDYAGSKHYVQFHLDEFSVLRNQVRLLVGQLVLQASGQTRLDPDILDVMADRELERTGGDSPEVPF